MKPAGVDVGEVQMKNLDGPRRLQRRGPRLRRGLIGLLTTVMAMATLAVIGTPTTSAAADPCAPGANRIVCENSKPGSPPSEWDDFEGAGDASIQGFATDISVDVGRTIDFKVDTSASDYSIAIYRTGYYGGDGARLIATIQPSAQLPQQQAQCISDVTTELYDCGNWAVSASWTVPTDAVSGVYVAKLTRADTGGSSHITFIVRDDASHSDLVFQTSDPTWEAYNTYGGSDFYQGAANGRAYEVSYNRPFSTRGHEGGRDFYFSAEYAMVRFLEKNGYDVSYISGVDTDRHGNLLTNHKTFLSVGHDEYWSKGQRANVTSARDAGVNLMFLSGNEMYWKTRYESSADGSNQPYRTLVCYKETWSNAKIDPDTEWTGTWRDPRYAPQSAGAGSPENALTGTAYMVNNDDLAVTVNAEEGKLRLWRNAGLANLPAGSAVSLAPHTVGYESDEDLDNGFRPPGLIRLSTTSGPTPQYLQDFGNTVSPGTTEHHVTMYRAASGALVFGAGSVQWTWGLDATHDGDRAPADDRMQQAQVNLLADMAAQPSTLAPPLVPATASSDTTVPTVSVDAPPADSGQPNGRQITLTGTANDVGGSVAGVEVSTDRGESWHPATGTASWSYSYVQHGVGRTPVWARAVDDSANIGDHATVSFDVSCSCSIFGDEVPATAAADDPSAAELGLRFTATADGYIAGVRFYKGAGNSGTHVGTLWSASGQRLATVTFSNETQTGWQTATFVSPVPAAAGQTFVVSYSAPSGHYAVKQYAFSSLPLRADPFSVAGGFGVDPAGVYSNAGSFPLLSFRNSNYYVDPIFTTTDDSPLVAVNQWPVPDALSAPRQTAVTATLSKPAAPVSVAVTLVDSEGVAVPGSTGYDTATRAVTFTPSEALSGFVRYTATISATDLQGTAIAGGSTWSFTTAKPPPPPGICPCGLFDDETVPTILEAADPNAVTLGVRFSPDADGTITGVRFYKGPNNTGTHTGSLWSASGAQLASADFAQEGSSGWQTVTFAQPIAVTKNTVYVAAYRTTVGSYSVTPGGLGQPLDRSPLHAPANAGAFTYGAGFPGSSSSASYLVDPVFEGAVPQISVAGQDPAPGAVDIPRTSPIDVWFTSAIRDGYSLVVSESGLPVGGTTTLGPDRTGLTFQPSAALGKDALVRVDLTGVRSLQGASLPDQSWTFRTETSDYTTAPATLFGDRIPYVAAADDASPVELGVAFSPTVDGTVMAIRFFKGSGNGGAHVGSLWTAGGTRLATVQFANETPSGWQSARLAEPVDVRAGQRYVVSYLAPQGHYAYTAGFFSQDWSAGRLTAPAVDNGRYVYGSAGGFPAYSFGGTNYFVDVAFRSTVP